MNTSELLAESQRLLDTGEHSQAVVLLRSIRHSDLSRGQTLQLASLARSCGEVDFTIRLLNSRVRGKMASEATPQERAIYAGALIKLGATEEAWIILKDLEGTELPDVFFFKAQALMAEWNYREAAPLLNEMLALPHLSARERFLARLNLAACLVCEDQDLQALQMLSELEKEQTEVKLGRFRGTILELSAQAAIHLKHWSEADRYLSEAENVVAGSPALEAFLVRKWRLFLGLVRDNFPDSAVTDWQTFRKQAEERCHWETVRDSDYIYAILRKDQALLTHLYFGTPFESFRIRLFRHYGTHVEMPDYYDLPLERPKPKSPVFDPIQDAPGIAERLLLSICQDFYRPARLETVFGKLYPGEFFNPESSPGRVYTAISNSNKLLKSQGCPLEIGSTEHGYRLTSTGPCWVRVPNRLVLGRRTPLEKLKSQVNDGYFSVGDAMKALEMSRGQVQRLLKTAVENGTLARSGSGPSTLYSFQSSSPTRKAS